MFVTMFVWKCVEHRTTIDQQWLPTQFPVHSHEDMSLVSINGFGMAILYLSFSLTSPFLVDPEHLHFLPSFVGEFDCQWMIVFSGIQC